MRWIIVQHSAIGVGACLLLGATSLQQGTPTGDTFVVMPIAEKIVSTLPSEPLYWVVERFGSHQLSMRAATPHALIVDEPGKAWRFTLSHGKIRQSKGTLVAQIGPVPVPEATRYLLRINRAGGPPNTSTPVHTHPGSEAFFVLSGSLCQKTEHGSARVDEGGSMNGHAPELIMQLTSCGNSRLDQYVMFVVDADKPFSTPAKFN